MYSGLASGLVIASSISIVIVGISTFFLSISIQKERHKGLVALLLACAPYGAAWLLGVIVLFVCVFVLAGR